MLDTNGKLYIVATPIGNLGDITFRAVETLKHCDVIAAEDTRQTVRLLEHYGIKRPLVCLHEHNESRASTDLIKRLQQGESVALVSDAGTPLISDPGYELVSRVRETNIPVIPIPGPCAVIAALSASGMATDRFSFVGFPPRGASTRKAWMESLIGLSGTLIFYESCHRISACLREVADVFPDDRKIAIARELTKIHETILTTSVSKLCELVSQNQNLSKGEVVVLIQGANQREQSNELHTEHIRTLKILLQECSVKTAATLAAKITGLNRKAIYRAALELKQQ